METVDLSYRFIVGWSVMAQSYNMNKINLR